MGAGIYCIRCETAFLCGAIPRVTKPSRVPPAMKARLGYRLDPFAVDLGSRLPAMATRGGADHHCLVFVVGTLPWRGSTGPAPAGLCTAVLRGRLTLRMLEHVFESPLVPRTVPVVAEDVPWQEYQVLDPVG